MKRIIILGIALFCVQWMNAQTECENMFSKAINYYAARNYPKAKEQFQEVVEYCPLNADIAREYIRLCDGWNDLKAKLEKQPKPNAQKVDSQRIKKLENRISNLQTDSTKLATTINTYAEKMKAKSDTIDCLKIVIKESVNMTNQCKEEKDALYGSLRDLGKELNAYLGEKLSNENKKNIIPLDSVGYDTLVTVMKTNLKLVNEIKTRK